MGMCVNVSGMCVPVSTWWGVRGAGRRDVIDLMSGYLTKSLPNPCTSNPAR